jgi:hypothetical protein
LTSGAQGRWQAQFPLPQDPGRAAAKAAFQAIFPGPACAAFDVTTAVQATLGDWRKYAQNDQ